MQQEILHENESRNAPARAAAKDTTFVHDPRWLYCKGGTAVTCW